MMNTYPICEPAALYIDKSLAPYIILASDRYNNTVPEEVQLLLDIGKFNEIAQSRGETDYTIRQAIQDHPDEPRLKQYQPEDASIAVLMPDDYFNTGVLMDAIGDIDADWITASEFTGDINTYEAHTVADCILQYLVDEPIVYLIPSEEATYFRHAPYKNLDELLAEYRYRLIDAGVDLPDGFNLRRLVCNIEGTYIA